jgi:hypothetical protein
MLHSPHPERLNVWTIGSIAVVAYCLTSVLHEGLGHGGACFLMRGRANMLNAILLNYDPRSVSDPARRFIAAAGSLVNLAVGALAMAWLRLACRRSSAQSYFFWLLAAINFLMAFGYLLFSGISGVGDWAMVVDGVGHPLGMRLGLVIVGAVLYFRVAPKLLIPDLARLLDGSYPTKPQVDRLVRFPYFVGGVTFLIAGLFNPYGLKLILISAVAASFGGTALLISYPFARDTKPQHDSSALPFQLNAQIGWVVAAAITLIIFIGILGPGIRLPIT